MAKHNGGRPISDDDGKRQILNNLLLQKGIALIKQDEKPADGVRRLLTVATDNQRKTLEVCFEWLRQPRVRKEFVGASSTAVSAGMIFRGVSYTPEETEMLEAICSQRKVSMQEAVEIMRGKPAA